MCGIVGLFLKDDSLAPQFGSYLAPMLGTMSERGPDSAGFAVYGDRVQGHQKISLYSLDQSEEVDDLDSVLSGVAGAPVTSVKHDNHTILSVPTEGMDAVMSWLAEANGNFEVAGSGARVEVYKAVGLPTEVVKRLDLAHMSGTHGIGHSRMATESAVTVSGAHPFSTGPDQCLVHNGSLSNHNALRRMLMHDGFTFKTENDSEVAAAYLTWRMRQGLSLGEALEASLADLDGFFTFVVSTENGFGVLRDPIACKPAVMAETDAYVAFGSEYRALIHLPKIKEARVWEPDPAHVYFWERGQ